MSELATPSTPSTTSLDPAWIVQQIMWFSYDRNIAQEILKKDENEARDWIAGTQLWLDTVHKLNPMRPAALHLLIRLADLRDIMPPSVLVPTRERLVSTSCRWKTENEADLYSGTYDSQPVVVKKIRYNSEPLRWKQKIIHNNGRREALLWRQLSHPSILAFIGVDAEAWNENKHTVLLSPLIPHTLREFVLFQPLDGSEAERLVTQPRESFLHPDYVTYDPAKHRMSLLTDIANAIHYLHSLEIVHGDITWDTVQVTRDAQAVLTDFGLAFPNRTALESCWETTPKGIPGWTPPERLRQGGQVAPSVDIFAFGCITYAICTGSSPWNYLHDSEAVKQKIRDGDMPPIPPNPAALPCVGPPPSEELRSLIKSCWLLEPKKRPHITAVLAYLGHRALGKLPLNALCTARATSMYRGDLLGKYQLPIDVGGVFHIFEMNGSNWLARSQTGAVGFVHEAYFADPFLCKATLYLDWSYTTPDGTVRKVSEGETVDVIVGGIGTWKVRDSTLTVFDIESNHLRVNLILPRIESELALAMIAYSPRIKGYCHHIPMRKKDVMKCLPRDGDWVIAWVKDRKGLGLIPTANLFPLERSERWSSGVTR